MGNQLAADLVVLLHLAFIGFVLFGGLLCFHRIIWIRVHLPAVLWGVWVEWSGWICPLTPLENYFRHRAASQGYQEGFVSHYLIPLIYPEQLPIALQWFLGGFILMVNLFIYLCVLQKRRKRKGAIDG